MKREEEINQQSQELVELRKNYSSESEKVRVVRFLSFFLFLFESDEIVKTFKRPRQHVIHEFYKVTQFFGMLTFRPRIRRSPKTYWLFENALQSGNF